MIWGKYFELISSLPHPKYAPGASSNNRPIYFEFDGGDGWVMGCKPGLDCELLMAKEKQRETKSEIQDGSTWRICAVFSLVAAGLTAIAALIASALDGR
jgi:hypothetical protein